MLQNELDMGFNYEPVTYGEIKDNNGEKMQGTMQEALNQAISSDKTFADIYMRISNTYKAFGHRLIHNDDVCATVLAGHRDLYDYENRTRVSVQDIINAQTFPQDYNFGEMSYSNVEYICGMSVPPIMIKRIVTRLIESGVFDVSK